MQKVGPMPDDYRHPDIEPINAHSPEKALLVSITL